MNYIKAQQDLLADMLSADPLKIRYYKAPETDTTAIFNSSAVYGYVIPNNLVALDLSNCIQIGRDLMFCKPEEENALTPTGVEIVQAGRKLQEYKNRDGVCSYFDKQLVGKFGKGAQLYQTKPRSAATIAEGETVVGYLCPVNYRNKEKK